MEKRVKLEKRMTDGSYVFCTELGTYFRLTADDVYDLVELIEGGPLPGPPYEACDVCSADSASERD